MTSDVTCGVTCCIFNDDGSCERNELHIDDMGQCEDIMFGSDAEEDE